MKTCFQEPLDNAIVGGDHDMVPSIKLEQRRARSDDLACTEMEATVAVGVDKVLKEPRVLT